MLKREGVALEDVCLLDPKAEQELTPEDGTRFKWFLFGVSALEIWIPPYDSYCT